MKAVLVTAETPIFEGYCDKDGSLLPEEPEALTEPEEPEGIAESEEPEASWDWSRLAAREEREPETIDARGEPDKPAAAEVSEESEISELPAVM